MRRYRTRTTAWPAVADLMTALAVVGLAGTLVGTRGGVPDLNAQNDSLRAQNDTLKVAVDSLNAVVDSLNVELAKVRVGFLPCWPRNDPPRYYRTYHVTFQDGRLSVTPHEHWALGTELRRTIPPSLVNVLEGFPRGEVTGEQLASFGERVDRALRETDYPPDCSFAVALNDGGKNETDIVRRAGFYPVWRQ